MNSSVKFNMSYYEFISGYVGTWQADRTITVYKKVWASGVKQATGNNEQYVISLEIPPGTIVIRPIGSQSGKIRVSKAKVIAAYDDSGVCDKSNRLYYSGFDPAFEYHIGAEVMPNSWDESVAVSCTHGIHAFCSYVLAKEYNF